MSDAVDWDGIAERVGRTISMLPVAIFAFEKEHALPNGGLMKFVRRKRKKMALDTLASLAEAANVNPAWLIFGDEKAQPTVEQIAMAVAQQLVAQGLVGGPPESSGVRFRALPPGPDEEK